MMRILDAKYKKTDLAKVIAESVHLTNDKQSKLLDMILCRYKHIFDGGLGLKNEVVKRSWKWKLWF